jgi:hypothetical protein
MEEDFRLVEGKIVPAFLPDADATVVGFMVVLHGGGG